MLRAVLQSGALPINVDPITGISHEIAIVECS
jgi:hypothetical protein